MPSERRFPPPWTIDEANNACFIVRDSTGQALGYFYIEDEPGRRSAAKLLTEDEARRFHGGGHFIRSKHCATRFCRAFGYVVRNASKSYVCICSKRAMTFAHHGSCSCGLTHRKRKQNAMIASFISLARWRNPGLRGAATCSWVIPCDH